VVVCYKDPNVTSNYFRGISDFASHHWDLPAPTFKTAIITKSAELARGKHLRTL
jgi:hypothetical protein